MKPRKLQIAAAAPELADSQAMSRIASGDLGGLGELYDRHAKALHTFIRRFDPGEDADDLMQAVFLRALQKAAEYDDRNPTARAWLFGIAAHVLQERRRSIRRLMRALLAYDSASDAAVEPSVEAKVDVKQCLSRISPLKRLVLILFEIEGFTCQEISDLLGVPIGTVWTRLHHARRDFAMSSEEGLR
jgi:RNA polymerase sigma-70 factor (ECF subfamily)